MRVDINERLYGVESPQVAENLLNLGQLQGDLSRPVEAEKLLRLALKDFQQAPGNNSIPIAKAQNAVAIVLIAESLQSSKLIAYWKLVEAEELCWEAILDCSIPRP